MTAQTQPDQQLAQDATSPAPLYVYTVTMLDGTVFWINDLAAQPQVDPDARWLTFRVGVDVVEGVDVAGFNLNLVAGWRRVPFAFMSNEVAGEDES
jgi:hypothetical protein